MENPSCYLKECLRYVMRNLSKEIQEMMDNRVLYILNSRLRLPLFLGSAIFCVWADFFIDVPVFTNFLVSRW